MTVGMNSMDMIDYIEDEELRKYWGYLIKFSKINGHFDEELMQIQLEKFYEMREKFDSDKASFSTWVYLGAKRCRIDYIRNRKSEQENEVSNAEEVLQYVGNDTDSVEQELMISEIIEFIENKLTNRRAKIVKDKLIRGKNFREIGEELDISKQRVEQLYSVSLDRIRCGVL